ANIVANAILNLAPAVPPLMAPGAVFIASGIIDERKEEVIEGLKKSGLVVDTVREDNGWVALICYIGEEN
ncbi:Ribosomal L11 methyltransferase, partial [gut metagenome]